MNQTSFFTFFRFILHPSSILLQTFLPAKNRQKVCAPSQEAEMNRHILLLFCVLSVGVCRPGSARAGDTTPSGQRDLASEVRAVFAAKCAGCHGSDLAKPKGRFGYVLDLARVASNREMVVPFRPSESELWDLVERGEMPPAEAPTGTLTAQQQEVIQAWIAAGAPPAASSPPQTLQAMTQPPEEVPAEPTASPPGRRFLHWIGKFHLLLLHFPLGLLVAAAIAECWSLVRASRVPAPAVRFCVILGATFAVATVALGWLHAFNGYGAGMPRLLNLHRWLGTAAGLWVVGTAVFSEQDARRGERRPLTRVLLFVGALLIGLSGHFGGLLAHGEDFFDW
jgi:mono/diheme cytochrome c family protein